MVFYSATLTDVGDKVIVRGVNGTRTVPTSEAIALSVEQLSGCGREHVCWIWPTKSEAGRAALSVFAECADPPDLVVAKGGVICGRYPSGGRWHWRCLDQWTESGVDPLEWIERVVPHLPEVNARFSTTPGSSVARAWISSWHPIAKWASPLSVEENDFARRAVYGGRCEWTIGRFENVTSHDIRSAYPWAVSRPMPDVEEARTDRMSDEGVAEVTITLNTGSKVIPVQSGRSIRWPTSGTFRGVWPTPSIRYAVEHGAVVEDVHQLMTWGRSYSVDGGLQKALFMATKNADDDLVKEAFKRMSRTLHGKWAQRRSISIICKQEQVQAAYDRCQGDETPKLDDGSEIIERIGSWGAWEWLRVLPEEYPRHVCPIWSALASARVTIRLDRAEKKIIRTGARVLYLDTDGVYHTGGRGALRELGLLGGWAHKGDFEWIDFFGRKSYVRSDGRRVMSGIPAQCGALLIATGKATYTRPVSLAETMTGKAPGYRTYTIRMNHHVRPQTPRDPGPQNPTPRDLGPRDLGPRDIGPRDPGH